MKKTKNAIIINGETYELVENTTGKDVCETCDLLGMILCTSSVMPCVDIHKAEHEYHYVRRPKGGDA